MAGGATRLGPKPSTGPIRSENTGSVIQVASRVRMRNVECPIQAIVAPSPDGDVGTSAGSTGTRFGQAAARLVNCHRSRSRSPGTGERPGGM